MNNKKIYKYIGVTFVLIFLLNIAKAAKKSKTMFLLKNFDNNVRLKLLSILDALQNLGLNELQIKLALSQILLETGQFSSKSNVVKLNNNFSGIKFINKPYQIATRGSNVPPSERISPVNSPINFYAKFADVAEWAKDYVRILNLRKNKPLTSNSIEEFHKRLTANRYYDTSKQKNIDNYLKMLRLYYQKIV